MKKYLPYIFFILATIFLTFSFYRDGFGIVEAGYHDYWQSIFDRTVIARLVKTQQDGFLSAGGLLGLGDANIWDADNKTIKHQYDVYLRQGSFKTYNTYASTPGFQGVLFGVFDQLLQFPTNVKLKLFRRIEAIGSALVLALICVWLAKEFGWLAGIFTVLFVGISEALIRSADSIYWNLWVFYLPLMICTILLAEGSKKQTYRSGPLLWAIFVTCLIKVLMNGFEGIATVMAMVTVPLIYYAVLDRWNWKILLQRFIAVGLVLFAAVITGLIILSIQIALAKGTFSASSFYIWDAFSRRAIGDPDQYSGLLAESMRASYFEVIGKYLRLDSISIHWFGQNWHLSFWGLFMIFALFTIIFVIRHRENLLNSDRPGWALVIATWYSFLAPISWFIVFKPDAYLHTSIYKMLWYMPFILLGLSVCGFVITDLFKRNPKLT